MQNRSAATWVPAGGPVLTAFAILGIAVLLVAVPPLYGVLAVAGAIVAATILVRPRWGFYLLLLSIPVQNIGAAGELTLTNALFGLTLAAWLASRLTRRHRPLPSSAVGPLFTLFVAALALSLTVARELGPGIGALFQWVKALLVFFMALDFLRTRRQVAVALGALLTAGTAEGALGLVQFLTGAGPASFAIGAASANIAAGPFGGFTRAYGTFGRPNSYAGYLEMIFPLGLALTCWFWHVWRARPVVSPATPSWQPAPSRGLLALLAAGATGVTGLALLASNSRGAWLGLTSGVVVMTLLSGARARAVALLAALAAVPFGLAGGFALVPAGIRDRFTSILGGGDTADVATAYVTAENFAILERKAHWLAGLAMFVAHPLLGVGLGNFNARFSEFSISPTFLISQGHAHNYYIHVAAEAGLLGLTAYLLLLATLIGAAARALRATAGDPFGHAIVVGACGVITAVAVHNVFEVLHVLSMGIQLSTIWALLTVARWDTPPVGPHDGPTALSTSTGKAKG